MVSAEQLAKAAMAVPEPPADLAEDVRAVWRELAPLAVARWPLTAATLRSFGLFCRNVVLEERLGLDPEQACSPNHRGMIVAVTAGLLRFDLAPNGKPHGTAGQVEEQPKSALDRLKERRQALKVVG
jgi:hypothetical protein